MVTWVSLTEAGELYHRSRERVRQIAKNQKWERRETSSEVLIKLEDVDDYFLRKGINTEEAQADGDKDKYLKIVYLMGPMRIERFKSELEWFYESHNPDEMDRNSKVIFAATLTMQLRRKGYRGSFDRFYRELGVNGDEVHDWYQNLFGESVSTKRKSSTPRFEPAYEKTMIGAHEASRHLGISLPHLITAIRYGNLPAEEKDGVYIIPRDKLDSYETFLTQWKPIKTTSKLLKVSEGMIENRVGVGMIKNIGERPHALVNFEDAKRACNQPLIKKSDK